MLIPNSVIVPSSWLRKGIGASQPRRSVPTALTSPSCGDSRTVHTNVIATTGATHGSSITPRTRPRPRNGRRTSSAAHEPEHDRAGGPEDGVLERRAAAPTQNRPSRTAARSCAACTGPMSRSTDCSWISRMRLNDRTSAQITGRITMTRITRKVGETMASPARASRRARVSRARGAAWPRPAAAARSEERHRVAYSRPAWISSMVALASRELLGRVGAADHGRHRAGERLLAGQRAEQGALPLREGPALEVLHALAERRRSTPGRRTRSAAPCVSTPLSSSAQAVCVLLRVLASPGADGVLALRREPQPAHVAVASSGTRRRACARRLAARLARSRSWTRSRTGSARRRRCCSGPTSPLFSARKAGFFLHSGQDGLVSARRPAMPSSRNGDQNIIAARPAK